VAYEDYLDLEAADRFLLHALESASTEVQQRALRMLGHVSWEHRDNKLKAESQRANNNARRAEQAEKRAREAEDKAAREQDRANRAVGDALTHKERAKEAEDEVEGWRDSAHDAERSAEERAKRVKELENLLHNVRGTMLTLAADVFDKVGEQ